MRAIAGLRRHALPLLVAAGSAGIALAAPSATAWATWSQPIPLASTGQASEAVGLTVGFGADGVLRPVWGQGHALKVGLVTRAGVRRSITIDHLREPFSRPASTAALARGRTLAMWESGRRIRLLTLDARGSRVDSVSIPGVYSNAGPTLARREDGGALACWWRQIRISAHVSRTRIQVARISAAGRITTPLTVAQGTSATRPTGDCLVATRNGRAVVAWTTNSTDTWQLLIRRISAAGSLGPPLEVLPAAQRLYANGGEPMVDLTTTGEVAVAWLHARGEQGQRRMRWIGTTDQLGPVVHLGGFKRPTAEARLHVVGDRAEVFSTTKNGLSAQAVTATGSVGSRRQLFKGTGALALSTASNGHKVALAWEVITRQAASIYAATWTSASWHARRIAAGGLLNLPTWPRIGINASGRSGLVFDLHSSRFPFEIGPRAALN